MQVRTAVSIKVHIRNPLDHEVELMAKYSHPSLLGPTSLVLPVTQEPIQFEFFYAPLVAGESQGSLMLENEEVSCNVGCVVLSAADVTCMISSSDMYFLTNIPADSHA